MRTTITKTLMAAFVSAMALLFAVGCGEKEPPVISVSSVSLSKTSITIKEGSSESLSATVSPSDAQNKAVSWSSSNSSVATVDNSGRVTGVKAGSATITVTTSDGGKTATCSVTVEANIIAVTGVTLDKTTAQIPLGGDVTLAATVAPADATDKSVTWTSSDEAVAKVSGGKVTAVAVGKATITAKTNDGGKTATCEVSVIKPVESVTISDAETMVPVEGEVTLTVTVTPEDATIKDIEWSSSDESIAKVDATGKVTGVAEGTATITAKTVEGGKTATCKVIVGPKEVPVEGVEFAEAEVTVIEGESAVVTVNFTPAGATNKNVTYKSSDTEVATVDAEGNVTGIKPGQVTITVTTEDGGKTDECVVTVEKAPVKVTGVELNYKERTINIGNAGTLIATVLPKDATNKNVTWTVSDESVLKVTQDGVVTPKKEGTATVTVTTEDGGFTATCEVTATAKVIAVSSVKLDKSSLSLMEGKTAQLKATVSPANATNAELTWTSSKPSVATVDAAGNITAVAPGTATITAKSENGKSATCAVTVTSRYTVKMGSTEITENYNLTIDLGETVNLVPFDKVNNAPIRTTLSPSSIKSGNSNIAEVNLMYGGGAGGISAFNEWKITGKNSGSTTVTITYGSMTRRINVKVKEYTIYYNDKEVPSTLNVITTHASEAITFTLYNKTEGKKVYVGTLEESNKYTVTSSNPNVATEFIGYSAYFKYLNGVGEGTATLQFYYKKVLIKTITLKVIHAIEVRYGGSALGATSTYYWNGQSGHTNRSIRFSYYDKVDGKLITLSSSNSSKFEIKSSNTSIISNNLSYGNTDKISYAYAYGTAKLTFTYNDVEIATTNMTVKEPRFGIALQDLSNHALLVEDSSATPYFFYVNKDGSERFFTLYDYDIEGSISNKLTYSPSIAFVSTTNSKFHFITYTNDSNHHARIAFSQTGAKDGEKAIITFRVQRPNGTWHTVRLEVRNGI